MGVAAMKKNKREPIGAVTVYAQGGAVVTMIKVSDHRLTGRANLAQALRLAAQRLCDDALTGTGTAVWPKPRRRRRTCPCRCLAGGGKRMRPDIYRSGNTTRCARCKLVRRRP